MSRPRMVMAVGNTVEGDSRVEKAAVSARKLGYDVIVVGVKQKTVSILGSYDGIPIYRPVPDWSAYLEWRKANKTDEPAVEDVVDELNEKIRSNTQTLRHQIQNGLEKVQRLRYFPRLLSPNRFPQSLETPRDFSPVYGPILDHLSSLRESSVRARMNLSHYEEWMNSAVPGAWRSLWPQIEGFEELFLRAFRELKPDIIHVHDRHPMSAAMLYQKEMQANGKTVPWVYDAHEYLPGQRFSGPAGHRFGWLGMESEMIQYADRVITVSDELAANLQRRHHLAVTPSVVANAPHRARVTNPDPMRQSLREELELDKDTPLIVYVGKLAERRGIYTAVEALAELPNVHLAFVGSKDLIPRQKTRDLATKMKLEDRVHIVDYVPSKYVTSYVSSADIGLSPLYGTKAHHQALATKIREYLQAGLPIVGTDLKVQGAFLKQTRAGAVHIERDPHSLAAAVRKILSDLDSYKQRVEKLRKEHSWEAQELILESVWHGLVPCPPADQSPTAAPQNPIPLPLKPRRQRRVAQAVQSITSAGTKVALAYRGSIYLYDGYSQWFKLGDSNGPISEQRAVWAELIQLAEVLLAIDFEPLFEESMGNAKNLKHQLDIENIPYFALIDDEQLDDPEVLIRRSPLGIWGRLTPQQTAKATHNRLLARQIVNSRGMTPISFHPSILTLGLDGVWIPPFLPTGNKILPANNAKEGKILVGITAIQRTAEELTLLHQLSDEFQYVDFRGITENDPEPVEATFIIDSLNGLFFSNSALEAMKNNVPVLARIAPDLLESLEVRPQFIETSPETIKPQLKELFHSKLNQMNNQSPMPVAECDNSSFLEYLRALRNEFDDTQPVPE